jgi:hypothetical protein
MSAASTGRWEPRSCPLFEVFAFNFIPFEWEYAPLSFRDPIDPRIRWWDNPTMTTRADSKKRIVLPTARPGDVFEVQDHGDGRFTLVRLVCPEPKARLTREQCLKAIAASPLHPKMDWATLRRLTREP